MPNTFNRITAKAQAEFLDTAVTKGVDAAVEKHGDIVTAGEAAALKKLSPAELASLKDIQTKIIGTRAAGRLAADWTCVNVVC